MRALPIVLMGAAAAAAAWFILSSDAAPEMGARVAAPPSATLAAPDAPDEGAPGLLSRWLASATASAGGAAREAAGGGSVYYQYVDDGGAVHFVASLEEVPAPWRDRAGRIEVERKPATPAPPPAAAHERPARRPFSDVPTPTARADGEVVVYTTKWCGWCRKTLAWLDQRGVDYVNKDIESDDRYRSELVEKTGRTSIPVVEIDGELIRGYDPGRMAQLLRAS
jgi:glutaredoxin